MIALNVGPGGERCRKPGGLKCFGHGPSKHLFLLFAAQLAFGQQGTNDRSAGTYRSGSAGATPDVSGVAEKIVTAFSDGDLEAVASMYADTVDYLDSGRISSADVRSQIAEYFARWPIRHWELTGQVKVQPTGASLHRVVFSAQYDVSNPDSNRHSAGIARETLVVTSDAAGAMKIISHHEKTSSRSGSNNKRNPGRSERPRIYDSNPVALLPPSPESTPGQLAFGQQRENAVGRYSGECVLENEPMHVDFEIVTNAKYSGGCCDAILTFTPKKSGASPVTPLTMTGGVARQMEPHRRTDRTPPVYKRHFDFTAERTKSEKDRERYRLSLVETGNDLEGTLEITKSGADRPNINSTVPLRLGPDVTQGTGDEAVAKSNEPAEAQAAPDPSNITGVYEGTYVANKREFSVELTLDRKADSNALKGVLTTFVGGVGSESLGSYNLSGDFEPLTNSFKLTPGQWIGASGGRQVGLEGTVEAAAGKLRGKTTVEAGTFELTRNPHKSSALQAKAAREERKFKEAPVALAAARSDEARCATLVRWFGKLKHEYPDIDVRHTVVDKLYPKVVNLFADDDFVPVFGKPFDVLSAEEREYFKEMGRRLFSTQPNRDLIDGFIDFLFDRPFGTTGTGNYSFPDIAGQVAFRRGITKKWHAAFEHLKEVPPTSAGFDDILTTKRAGDETFADLWPSQMEEFHDAVNAAKHRIADSALKERISMAVATAKATQDPSTLGVMQSGSTELFELASADAKNQVVAELDASIAGLLEKEEQASPITGSGLDAVTAGNAWYRRLRDAYGFAVDRPPVRQAIERLTSRRSSDLAGALATIVAEISQQEGESGLKHVKETYLAVAGDDDTEAGRRISKAMEARVAALKRAVALQRFSPNERKLVQDDLTIAIPDLVPEPDDDDLRVAVVRTLERMGAKRTQPYEVEWHDFAGNQFGFYVVVTVKSAHRSSCVREGTGYKVGYYLEIACSNPSDMDFGAGSTFGEITRVLRQAFQEQLEGDRADHFELGKSGWWSPSMKEKGIISGNPY